jgi:hypothetical protein
MFIGVARINLTNPAITPKFSVITGRRMIDATPIKNVVQRVFVLKLSVVPSEKWVD